MLLYCFMAAAVTAPCFSWREVMDAFDDRFTVIAPDLLGYGKSDYFSGICGDSFYDIHIDCLQQVIHAL